MLINTTDQECEARDDEFLSSLKDQGFIKPRKLDDGEWVAVMKLLFSTSVCCGLDDMSGYKYRWCFRDEKEAYYFLENMIDFDEIPIKKTSLSAHRYVGLAPLYMELNEKGFRKW